MAYRFLFFCFSSPLSGPLLHCFAAAARWWRYAAITSCPLYPILSPLRGAVPIRVMPSVLAMMRRRERDGGKAALARIVASPGTY